MIEPKSAKSSSNLSDDSWTLVDDEKSEDEDYLHLIDSGKILNETETNPEKAPQECSTDKDEVEKLKDDGFLTFDEFFQERLIEHDYEHDDKPTKLKKLYKGLNIEGMRKCKAAKLSVATFFLLILCLSGLTALTSSYTNNHIQKTSPQFVKYNPGIIRYNTTLPNLNHKKTIEYPPIKETKLKPIHSQSDINALHRTISESPTNLKPPSTLIGPTKNPEWKKQDVIMKEADFEKLAKKFSDIASAANGPKFGFDKTLMGKQLANEKILPKNVSSKSTLREIIMSTNFHALASLIMTNVYLFMLVMDLSHRRRLTAPTVFLEDYSIEELKNHDKDSAKFKKLLFQQLPFHNARFGKKSRLENKNSVQKVAKIESKVKNYGTFTMETLNTPEIAAQTWSELTKSDLRILFPNSLPLASAEFGKSECQRRFDELDDHQRTFERIKQVQKDKIKMLKQKFKNEVSHIKDTEDESAARAEKINSTSRKFVKRLKHNREKYLIEMKRMREIKQKIQKYGDEHHCKRSRSDISVGNYSVQLPECYDFGKALKVVEKQDQPPIKWNFA